MSKMEWPRAGSYDLEVLRSREIRKIAEASLEESQNSEVAGNIDFRDIEENRQLREFTFLNSYFDGDSDGQTNRLEY